MTEQERLSMQAQYQYLRQASAESCLAFASVGAITYQARSGLPLSACIALAQYARCRGWQLYFTRHGHQPEARREAALAGQATRYFRSL